MRTACVRSAERDAKYRVVRPFHVVGKYVPFGVFVLYNDDCLQRTLEACLTVVLRMPFYQVEVAERSFVER